MAFLSQLVSAVLFVSFSFWAWALDAAASTLRSAANFVRGQQTPPLTLATNLLAEPQTSVTSQRPLSPVLARVKTPRPCDRSVAAALLSSGCPWADLDDEEDDEVDVDLLSTCNFCLLKDSLKGYERVRSGLWLGEEWFCIPPNQRQCPTIDELEEPAEEPVPVLVPTPLAASSLVPPPLFIKKRAAVCST